MTPLWTPGTAGGYHPVTFGPKRLSPAQVFVGLAAWLPAPLEEDFARRLPPSPAWSARLAELGERCAADDKTDVDAKLRPIVALTPPAVAGHLDADLASIPIDRRPRTTALVAFLRELSRLSPPRRGLHTRQGPPGSFGY